MPDASSSSPAPAVAELLLGIASTTPDFLYVFDRQGRFLFANRRLLEVWGRSLDDIIGKTCLELGYEQWHHDMHMREIAQVLETKRAIRGEVPFVAPLTGIAGVYEYIFSPVLGADGEVECVAGTTRDVSDRRRAEAELATTRRRLDSALIAGEVGTFEWEITEDRLYGDTNFARIFAIELDATGAAPLRAYMAAIHPDDHAHVQERLERALGSEEPYVAEYRILRADGTRWVIARGKVERDASGKPVRFPGVVLDVTARKRAELALADTRRRLDAALIAGEVGTFDLDAARGVVRGDGNLNRMFGVEPDRDGTAPVSRYLARIPEDDRARVVEELERAKSGADYQVEHRIVDGERTRWVVVRAKTTKSDAGATRTTGVVLEVTEQKRAENHLRESEERFRLMADGLPLIVWVHGADGQQQFVNRTYCEFFGVTRDEMTGARWQTLVHPDDAAPYGDDFATCVRERRPFHHEARVRNARGEWRWIESWAHPRLGPHGEYLGMVGCSADVHERKLFQSEREALLDSERAARQRLEHESRIKDEFLSTLSHELRTPLTSILGWTQILSRGATDERRLRHGIEVIDRNARTQAQLIDELLDMSRILSGKVRLELQEVDVVDVVEAACASVQPTADARRVRLTTAHGPGPHTLFADPHRLQQIVWNLLTNAVKFTPADGSVDVSVRVLDGSLAIEVRDTGEGIAPEFLPFVFDRFRQADGSTTRRHGGLGLGLSIVKHLAEIHGGAVQAESDGKGRGAKFTVWLPTAARVCTPSIDETRPAFGGSATIASEPPARTTTDRRAAVTTAADLHLGGVSVLVVEDDDDARDLVRRVLEEAGARVFVAESAAAALRELSAHPPTVLVSDIGMPNEDGYSLMRRVRALAHDGGRTRALALTAFARAEDRERALSAGFDGHLTKPINPQALIATVASLVATARS